MKLSLSLRDSRSGSLIAFLGIPYLVPSQSANAQPHAWQRSKYDSTSPTRGLLNSMGGYYTTAGFMTFKVNKNDLIIYNELTKNINSIMSLIPASLKILSGLSERHEQLLQKQ